MKMKHLFMGSVLAMLPYIAFSEAPVVDDSENFTMLDEQQTQYDRPIVRTHSSGSSSEERPLANDQISPDQNPVHQAALLDKLQGLQQDIQELRGQLEVQAHDLKLLQEQQLAFYKDLDARLPSSNTKMAKPTTDAQLSIDSTPMLDTKSPSINPIAPEPLQPTSKKETLSLQPQTNVPHSNNPADEQISYLAAYDLIKNKQFDAALLAMQTFVTQHPQGGYTANAEYWLGELYMQKNNYSQAINHFEVVLQKFPSSSKSAASLLKIGYALADSGKTAEAKQRLLQVIRNYPDTNTAQLASAKLKTLSN